ncbi:MAG: 3-hydroxybutyrate dehydrogenase [Gammaproteobacteria bacterium]|nr:3-hydroxybutyrate dehydrogenase [Gammaproteobacteria bacterium]
MLLKDKTCLVTGAGSGIGRGIAEAFAREGAVVGVADLEADTAETTARSIGDAGGRALALALDVTDEAAVDTVIDQLAARCDGIDVLVSNAGIQHIAALTELDYADWQRVLRVHLDGSFLTSRACLRHMRAQGRGGSILLMGSVHSKLASPLKAPYVTAKHGLIGLGRAIAREGAAYGVRANVICPGFVRTPLVDRQIPQQAEELGMSEEDVVSRVMLKDTVDNEFSTLDDVARAAVFFAAFPTNALTGQSLLVSHGWHME